MGVDFDFSDVDNFFDEGMKEVKDKMEEIGEEAVQDAKDTGTYQDQTGHLRESNVSEVTEDGLELRNEAEYASYVESKGFEVLSSAALRAESKLKEEFE